MTHSKRQIEVWKARRALTRKLTGMSPREQIEYFAGASARVEAKLGRDLKLRRAKPTPRGPIIVDWPSKE